MVPVMEKPFDFFHLLLIPHVLCSGATPLWTVRSDSPTFPQPPQRAMLEATGFRLLTYWQRTLVWLKPCRCSTEKAAYSLRHAMTSWTSGKPSHCFPILRPWSWLHLGLPKTTNPLKIGWLSLKRLLNLTNACFTPLSAGSWYRQVGGWECGTGPLPAMHANQLPSWFPQPVQSQPSWDCSASRHRQSCDGTNLTQKEHGGYRGACAGNWRCEQWGATQWVCLKFQWKPPK